MRLNANRRLFSALVMLSCLFAIPMTLAEPLVVAIREEAIRADNDPEGRPLPLAGHWHTGTTVPAYGPEYQMHLLEQGHFLIPWFATPVPFDPNMHEDYYEQTIKRAARLKLPIAFIGTQWERLLSSEPEFFDRPVSSNPNVVRLDGTIRAQGFSLRRRWSLERMWHALGIPPHASANPGVVSRSATGSFHLK